ncbi:TPA: hypothetical protein DEG21_02390 [Patescibacteria group bacterium]|nr:hypothetical protein [Candidatus Gracilibacteria bacterium]HBY74729.1 hypothetical protein [Candidatus Gracilibacteria bacterium]
MARIFLGAQGILWTFMAILFFEHGGIKFNPHSFFLETVSSLIFSFIVLRNIVTISTVMNILEIFEMDFNKIIKKGTCNPLRLSLFKVRIEQLFGFFLRTTICLILFGQQFIFSKFGGCYIFILFFRIIEVYFSSCTPLPPGTSKVRQWLKNMKESLSNVFAPEPALSPVKSYTNTNKY